MKAAFPKKKGSLVVVEGLLCRIQASLTTQSLVQVMVPHNISAIRSVIQANHDAPNAGHFGRKRTQARIEQGYHWPKMMRDVTVFVQSCKSCQRQKTVAPHPKNRPLNPSLPSIPNGRVNIDLIGPLPTTEKGHVYACVMIDQFTKWTAAVPISNKGEEAVTDAIYQNWYNKLGIPFEIQTDQGSEFTNTLLARINARMGVVQRTTTPYYPQGNGLVERFNRTLKNSLSAYCEEFPGTWDNYIDGVTFAYNTSVNKQTGYTPFFLVHGREARLPSDVFSGPVRDITHDVKQYQTNITYHLRRAHEIVRLKLEHEASLAKTRWDANIKGHQTFEAGDKVMIFQTSVHKAKGEADHSQVFKPRWLGPFTVVQKKYEKHHDVYEVKDEDTNRIWTINVHKMKKFIERSYLNSEIHEDTPKEHSVRLDEVIPVGDLTQDAETPPDEDTPIRKNTLTPTTSVSKNTTNHRSAFRHETGISKKEAQRREQREQQMNEPHMNLEELKEWEIERIISHKRVGTGKGKILYKVKWLGYDEPEDIPIDNFQTYDLLQAYWDTVKDENRPRSLQAKMKKKKQMLNRTRPSSKRTRGRL